MSWLTRLFVRLFAPRPRIGYAMQGRCGTVWYLEGRLQIPFYVEFGGGDCVANIDVPAAADWEARTGTALARREAILAFTARTVLREQLGGDGHCTVEDEAITFRVR